MKPTHINALVERCTATLVVIACIIAGTFLIASGIDHYIGIGMLVIVGGYLGIDLTPWIPLGKVRNTKPD